MSETDNETAPQPREHGHGYTDQEPASWIPGAILDAEIFIPPVLDEIQRVIDLEAPARIADIGCGPGVGTLELARRFPAAQVYGLDVGEEALAVATARAEARDSSGQVHFVRADFEQDMRSHLEPVDLVFASMSLHHTEDPAVALRNACDVARSGGRVVVAEFGRPLAIWPAGHPVVTSGLWGRWQAAIAAARLDHLGETAANVDWTQVVQQQPLTEVAHYECNVSYPAPLGQRERDWLLSSLTRGLQHNGDRLESQDREQLEKLLDPENPLGLAQAPDAMIDLSRIFFTGVRE